jgi:hypothetical protein
MKILNSILIFITCVSFISCAALKFNANTEDFNRTILSLTTNWNEIRSNTDLSPSNIFSGLPNRGVRGKYAIARNQIGIDFLEQTVGYPMFLKGPHKSAFDFRSEAFGYYNPDFLDGLKKILNKVIQNKSFVDGTQFFYDNECKRYLRTLFLAYDVAANRQDIMEGYKKAIAKNENSYLDNPSFYLQESFRAFAETAELSGYDVYESFTCPGFWVRRSIDGTESQFYELLTLMMKTYDNDFLELQSNSDPY